MYRFLDQWAVPLLKTELNDLPLGAWTDVESTGPDALLYCELWECDGIGGCNAAAPWLPDPQFGDDLIGTGARAIP